MTIWAILRDYSTAAASATQAAARCCRRDNKESDFLHVPEQEHFRLVLRLHLSVLRATTCSPALVYRAHLLPEKVPQLVTSVQQ